MAGGNGAVPVDVSRQNVALIMRAVLHGGPLPRADIAELTGISAATVTRLTARLTAQGLLVELPAAASTEAGRPRVPLAIVRDTAAVVGVHIGWLRTTIGLVDPTGAVLTQTALEHESTEPDAVVRQAVAGVRALVRRAPARRVLGVGVSVGGWFDTDRGVVVEHAPLGWRQVPLADLVAARLDHRCRFDGAVRAMALAECWFGAAREVTSAVELFVGNVVGCATVIDRRIHRGPESAAGTLTHVQLAGATGVGCECGRRGCLQAVVTDAAVVQQARQRGVLGPDGTTIELSELARSGDRAANALLRTRARHLGQAASLLFDLVNPELVVLAGDAVLAHPEHLPAMRRELAEHSHLGETAAGRLVPSTLGEHALVLASAAVLLDDYYTDPLSYEAPTSAATATG